jgi:serine protease DegS
MSIHQRYLHHAWKALRSVLIGLIVGGLLLAVMPSLRQWHLSPTTQYDSADESPASYNSAVRRAAPAVVNVYNRATAPAIIS